MDLVRSCYTTRMRFWVGSNRSVPVRWFFADPFAKIFPGYHRFASLNWEDKPWRDTGLGEVITIRRPWSNGARPAWQHGDRFCGQQEWYAEGLDPQKLYPEEWRDQNGLPECCFATGRGGVYITGSARVATPENGRLYYGERGLVAGGGPSILSYLSEPEHSFPPLLAGGGAAWSYYPIPSLIARGGLLVDGSALQEYKPPYLGAAGLLSAGGVRTSYSGYQGYPAQLLADGYARLSVSLNPQRLVPLIVAGGHQLARQGQTVPVGLVADGAHGQVIQYQGPLAGLVVDGDALVEHDGAWRGEAPVVVDGTCEGEWVHYNPQDPVPIVDEVKGVVAIWSNPGEQRGLEWMLLGRTGLFMYLFQNDFIPNDNMVLGDFQECNFTGYTRFLMAFPPQTIGGPPVATITAAPCSFQCDPLSVPVGNQVYGYYVVEMAFNRLMYAERFLNAPLAMNQPASIIVVVSTPTLRSEF